MRVCVRVGVIDAHDNDSADEHQGLLTHILRVNGKGSLCVWGGEEAGGGECGSGTK